LIPFPSEDGGLSEVLIPEPSESALVRVAAGLQVFQLVNESSSLLGYSLQDAGNNSGHFVTTTGFPKTDPAELQTRVLRLACHVMVDMTPDKGLQEMLEKASEIREYYCSLANWKPTLLTTEATVAVNPAVTSYEREPFTFLEE
jgi:hypothetical protein